jgi:FixJ family two-component response regulator
LCWLLESVGLRAEVFSSAAAFLASGAEARSGCLVTDLRMPEMSGLGLQQELKARGVILPIMFMTGHGTVQSAAHALREGAVDFVEKPFDDQRMLDLVQKAVRTDAERRRTSVEQVDAARRYASLSSREREVLGQLFEGHTTKEIARSLGLSAKTVETYRANVMAKMAAPTLPHLVRSVVALKREPERGA